MHVRNAVVQNQKTELSNTSISHSAMRRLRVISHVPHVLLLRLSFAVRVIQLDVVQRLYLSESDVRRPG